MWNTAYGGMEIQYAVELAVYLDPDTIKIIDDKYKNVEVCHTAVLHNGMLLEYVPRDQQVEDVLVSAIAQNPLALKYVKAVKTLELCRMAFVGRDATYLCFKYPLKHRNLEMYAKTHKMMADNIVNVPMRLRTEEICSAAYGFDKSAAEHFPSDIKARFVTTSVVDQ
jgi:hypothetical protein